MILERGDMWSIFGETGAFVITTNPIARSDGAIVMGRGIALQAKNRFPHLPGDFGTRLHERALSKQSLNFGKIGTYDHTNIYFFMVKAHWRDPADLKIIKRSTTLLKELAESKPKRRFDLNFPGIGNGNLPREAVLPIVSTLPNNVHIWEFE
jgi:hypothetical protein